VTRITNIVLEDICTFMINTLLNSSQSEKCFTQKL